MAILELMYILDFLLGKFQKQIFQPKLLPKNEPTNLFFYPLEEVLTGKFVFDFCWPLKVLTNRIAMVFTAGVKMYVHCSSNGVDETHLPSCTQRVLIVCNEMAVN